MQHGAVRDLDHRMSKRTTKSLPRARWNHQMKTFLIELLKDYDVPGYRTQNAWSTEAWNNITNRLNQKFGLSLAVVQVKQKEQDLKKDFRTVKDLVGESGFDGEINHFHILMIYLFLYEGRYAEGKNRHGIDHYASKAKQPSHEPPSVHSPSQSVDIHTQPSLPSCGVGQPDLNLPLDDEDEIGVSKFSQQQCSSRPPMCSTHMPSQQLVATPEMHETKHTKRRKTSDFQERYLKLKKEEIDRFAAIEEKKLEDPFSISKCVASLESLRGLQISDMVMAADIFKSKENRELFLSFSSDELRLGWVRNQIGRNQANQ
uniref:Uncharacterized protein n=1 Tax=Avena sativa TaxID=4498 RepID=A0ACD5U4M8_AVESA